MSIALKRRAIAVALRPAAEATSRGRRCRARRHYRVEDGLSSREGAGVVALIYGIYTGRARYGRYAMMSRFTLAAAIRRLQAA